jgi:hypothetical protein
MGVIDNAQAKPTDQSFMRQALKWVAEAVIKWTAPIFLGYCDSNCSVLARGEGFYKLK